MSDPRPPRPIHLPGESVFPGNAASLLGACLGLWLPLATEDVSIFNPASPDGPAQNIKGLLFLVTGVTAAIFVLVEGMLVYCIVRFRRRNEVAAAEPPQMYGSEPIEVAWTVAPLLIVFVLFLVVIRSVNEIKHDKPPPPGGFQITVVGHQWWWEYRYHNPDSQAQGEPEYLFVAANEMHIPVGQDVYLHLQSADVVHSFWVARLAGKTDVIPNRTNHMWFNAASEGVFLGQCAEYCGTQHAGMLIRVVADSPENYQQWAENQKRRAADTRTGLRGKDFFLSKTCANCHTIRGTPARGTFGPDLTHLMSRKMLASDLVENTTENLAAWLRDPQQIKPGCLMPNLQLSRRDIEDLVAYLRTLD